MNYKRTKTIWIGNELYNLENWVACGVKKASIRKDEKGNPIEENLFFIDLPSTDGTPNGVYMTYKKAKKYHINVHLGIPASAIDEMFLKAEVEDE